jgi:iron(III) transport system substrate-binding protein
MRRMPVRTSLSVLFLALTVLMQPRAGYSTVEETLAELNAKPAEERQKLLVENAKKEGTVTLYTATNIRDTQEVLAGFNKNYPFVKVSFSSLGGPGVLNKILTEYRAGMHAADVVILTGNNAVELIDKKIVGKYKSPMVPFLRKGFVDAEGYWPGVYSIGYTIIYNNKRVSAKDAPKRYEDLLSPRWKKSMIMDNTAHDLLAGLIDLWGEKKASDFLKRLAEEQAVTFARQSHTFMTQLVAAGEHDIIVDGYAHNAVKLKSEGAPIDYIFIPPVIVRTPSIVAVTSQPQHPYAAALLVDYHLSKEASEIMAHKQGRWTPRKDVRWTVEPETDLHVVSMLEWGRKNRQLVALFNKMTGQQ